MKFFTFEEASQLFPKGPDANLWTAVIPAAGRGSRLGYEKPKILYPVAGRPILDWLIDLLESRCKKLIFVLSPSGVSFVRPFLEKRIPGRYEIVIQDEPRGMADAIFQAVPKLNTHFSLILWGDQAAIRPVTLEGVMKIQQFNQEAQLTLPIVQRKNPYVHYATDNAGHLTHVFERREGAAMPEIGESDCGLFVANTKRLQEIFEQEREKGIALSQTTKEWNFLPLLPKFEIGGESVNALRLESLEETIGVNNISEAAILEKYLSGLSVKSII